MICWMYQRVGDVDCSNLCYIRCSFTLHTSDAAVSGINSYHQPNEMKEVRIINNRPLDDSVRVTLFVIAQW